MKLIVASDFLNPVWELCWYGAAQRSTSTVKKLASWCDFLKFPDVYMKSPIESNLLQFKNGFGKKFVTLFPKTMMNCRLVYHLCTFLFMVHFL